MWRALIVALGLLLADAAAADPATEQAKLHSARGKRYFDLGLFEQAAREYRQAYEAKPVPDLLYNLAQCHLRLPGATPRERQRSLEQAVHFLEGYRANAPGSEISDHVEREIVRLRREIEVLQRQQQTSQRRPFYKTWWFWTGVGVAVTGATVAAAVALRPKSPVVGTADPGIFYLP